MRLSLLPFRHLKTRWRKLRTVLRNPIQKKGHLKNLFWRLNLEKTLYPKVTATKIGMFRIIRMRSSRKNCCLQQKSQNF